MSASRAIAVLAIIALPAFAAPSAHAKPKKKANLKLGSVKTPPATIKAGASFVTGVTVRNRGRKAGGGRLKMSLVGGASPYDAQRQIVNVSTRKVRARGFSRLVIAVTIPADTGASSYRLRTCLLPNNKKKSQCKRGPRFSVTAGSTDPTPTATATATATSTSTPAPTATATPAPTVAPAVKVRDAVTVDGMMSHLRALQGIANDNGGTRASGTPGYAASLQYIKGRLQDAGYTTTTQTFNYVAYTENAPSLLERTTPGPTTTIPSQTFDYSPTGDVTGQIQTATPTFTPPRATGTDGCEDADFAGKTFTGRIALIQRGTCTFSEKAINAKEAGAIGVVIFNAGDTATPDRNDLFAGTLDADPGIPVVGVSYADGEALGTGGAKSVHIKTDTTLTPTTTSNLITETAGGRADRVVIVGSHLDSVPEGPGINDNGSGSAFNLELALQMAKLGIQPKNKVRFAWWGGEEAGLRGSNHYVEELTLADAEKIATNLNFDMLGSPNYIRYVYDGDNSENAAGADAGPAGSELIEKDFVDYFSGEGLATEPTAFDGRSDYGGFIAVGIPAGGLFSGAEDEKTQDQAAIFGGIPNVPFDPNYHEAGDTINNINRQGYGELSRGAAYVSGLYAFERDLPAPTIGRGALRRNDTDRGLSHQGAKAIR